MQIKTILNHVQKFKSFVYGEARLLADANQPRLEVEVHERRNSWALCSVCEQPASSYDRQRQRQFEFIPLWGIKGSAGLIRHQGVAENATQSKAGQPLWPRVMAVGR